MSDFHDEYKRQLVAAAGSLFPAPTTRAARPARGDRQATRGVSGRPPGTRRRQARRLGFTVIPIALAAAGFAVATSLSGRRPAIAQAAVISRAAAALDQPNRILYLRVKDYGAHGGICVRFGRCIIRSPGEREAGISANPADDTVTFSSQEWVSSDGSQEHTIYNDGTETVSNQDTHEDATYDPDDNTLTTLTDAGLETTQPPSALRSPLPSPSDFDNPIYYESLFREAQAGAHNVKLVGQTTIGGTSTYELRFDSTWTPPAHPSAGDMCGSEVCTPPELEILVYLDSKSFTPVRSVVLTIKTNNRPGSPAGTSVTNVTDFVAQTLPDTSANERLLQMSRHPDAIHIQQTEAQSKAALGAWMNTQIQAERQSVRASNSRTDARHRPHLGRRSRDPERTRRAG
jgi:hypothetical protein